MSTLFYFISSYLTAVLSVNVIHQSLLGYNPIFNVLMGYDPVFTVLKIYALKINHHLYTSFILIAFRRNLLICNIY